MSNSTITRRFFSCKTIAGGSHYMGRVQIPVSWLKIAAIVLLAAMAAWLFLLWQPARQVELHTSNLLARASSRDWDAVAAMMAENYGDTWGHDRASVIDEARQLFSHFFALHIVPLDALHVSEIAGGFSASAPIGVFGTGTAVAEAVIEEVREAGGEADFIWRKAGPWPWQWELSEVRHEKLSKRWPR
jgi:hypothetical protein